MTSFLASLLVADVNAGVIVLVAVLVVLAVVLIAAAFTRRASVQGTGVLSGETRRRDKSEAALQEEVVQHATGKAVERAAKVDRIGGELVPKDKGDISPYVPPDPETIGVTRRQFFNRSIVAFMGLAITGFGAAVVGFLWPQPKGGFGSKVKVGKISDIQQAITSGKGFYYVPEGRMWLTNYPQGSVDKAKKVYPQPVLNSLEAGVAVMYQKCPHLGCRVPSCQTSQWFECPCHGSQYNAAGEKKGGPAPRGMDRFATSVSDNELTVDTGTVIQGPPIGTNTTGQEAEGPHCVSGGGGHG